jgi:hypothetical protein
MAPQEVAGLQALAKAHGGTLTVNPDTGLPEAGFLSSILPMVAGAFLGPAGLGLTAMQAGLAGAALGTVATGSLQKGLMAGLGAYGGAGLAGGLMAAGAGAGAGAGAAGLGAAVPETVASATSGIGAAPAGGLVDAALTPAASSGSSYGLGEGMSKLSLSGAGPAAAPSPFNPVTTAQVASGTPIVPTATKMPLRAPIDPTFSGNLSQATQGFKNLGTEAGREAFLGKAATKTAEATGVGGYGGLFKSGLMGLAPVIADYMTPKQRAIAEQEKLKPYMYAYEPGRLADPQQGYTGAYTGERTYFNPVYTRTAAGGGLMDIGPVEAMSRSNQSQMIPAYARGGSSDVGVNPYTGAETFAEGGDTKAVKPVEQDPYYTMSGQSGDAFKYLMGQMPTTPRAPAPAAAPAPVQSTVQPVAAPRNPLRGGFGAIFDAMDASGQQTVSDTMAGNRGMQLLFGAGQDGEYVDDTSSNIRPYTFDPVTGTFAAAPLPKVYRPYTPVSPTNATPFSEMTSAQRAEMLGGGRFAQGGITGSGNLNLNIPLDLGGGQGGFDGTGGAGYSPTGTGSALQTRFNGQNNTAGGGFGMAIDPQGIMSDTFKGTGAFGGNPSEAIGKLSSLLGGRAMAQGGIASLAQGGQSHLGDYSDGGRLLRGPGDGVSDDIPATIGDKRPARLADGEFVVPARIVSELGNGSTEAGARKLYAMMDRVQKARKKSIGKNQVAVNSRAEKLLPA